VSKKHVARIQRAHLVASLFVLVWKGYPPQPQRATKKVRLSAWLDQLGKT
jgi:hypothetical protein